MFAYQVCKPEKKGRETVGFEGQQTCCSGIFILLGGGGGHVDVSELTQADAQVHVDVHLYQTAMLVPLKIHSTTLSCNEGRLEQQRKKLYIFTRVLNQASRLATNQVRDLKSLPIWPFHQFSQNHTNSQNLALTEEGSIPAEGDPMVSQYFLTNAEISCMHFVEFSWSKL